MFLIEIAKTDKQLLNKMRKLKSETIESYRLDGAEVIQFMIEITKITAPLIAGVIYGKLSSEKITVKKNGIEINARLSRKGISKIKLAEELLELSGSKNEE